MEVFFIWAKIWVWFNSKMLIIFEIQFPGSQKQKH